MALLKHDSKSIRTDLDWDFTGTVTGFPSGALTLIKSITASASSSISFVNGSDGVVLDDTYKAYKIVFKSIHQSATSARIQFNGSTDGGSNYNVTKTGTFFISAHSEGGSTVFQYQGTYDLAQSTDYHTFCQDQGGEDDETGSGEMWLYNPSSTTFVKHYNILYHHYHGANYAWSNYIGGYCNTTSPVDAIDFKMSSGNIDDGTISLYGLA